MVSRITAIATVIGVIVAALAWLFPHPLVTSPPPQSSLDLSAAGSGTKPLDEGETTGNGTGTEGTPAQPSPQMPVNATLRDGEQSVILSGQASVAVEFNRVGTEEFVTLRIHSGSLTDTHALLSATARVSFELQGKTHYISILNINYATKSVKLRIDRKKYLK